MSATTAVTGPNDSGSACEKVSLYAQYERVVRQGDRKVLRLSDPEAFNLPLSKDGPLLSTLLIRHETAPMAASIACKSTGSQTPTTQDTVRSFKIMPSKAGENLWEMQGFDASKAIESLKLDESLQLEVKTTPSQTCTFDIAYGHGH